MRSSAVRLKVFPCLETLKFDNLIPSLFDILIPSLFDMISFKRVSIYGALKLNDYLELNINEESSATQKQDSRNKTLDVWFVVMILGCLTLGWLILA